METRSDSFIITDDPGRVDFDRVHAWLAASYWSPGVARELVERAVRYSSLVVSVFDGDRQVGYARVVSDRATFAYLADVFVDNDYRGKGIGQAIVRFCLDHPEHQNMRRWVLRTADAHALYRKLGFETPSDPERYMDYQPSQNA